MPGLLRLLAAHIVVLTCASALSIEPDDLSRGITRYNDAARLPLPVPDDGELQKLLDGRSVILRERVQIERHGEARDRIRVVAYHLVQRPRLLVWLGALDISAVHSGRLTEHLVHVDDVGGSVWYQHINTPWPVRNRHWVIRNRKSLALAEATSGFAWQHEWRLDDDGPAVVRNLFGNGQVLGLTPRDAERAVYLSTNRGAWTMFEIDADTTLVCTHASATMDGWIPDSWVARFVARQLGGALENLAEKADRVHQRYDASYPVFTGAGVMITPAMAKELQRRWRDR